MHGNIANRFYLIFGRKNVDRLSGKWQTRYAVKNGIRFTDKKVLTGVY